MNNFLKLIAAIGVSELAGVIGSVFTASSVEIWYAGIIKPALNPPAWIFGPVWTTLYALMGIAAFLVWSSYAPTAAEAMAGKEASEKKKKRIKIALTLFGIQLVLNMLWSIIFFGLRSPGGALVEIVFLWLAILATIIAFAKISPPSSSIWTTAGHGKLAAWLLAPYIAWVSFAAYLNFAIWTLN